MTEFLMDFRKVTAVVGPPGKAGVNGVNLPPAGADGRMSVSLGAGVSWVDPVAQLGSTFAASVGDKVIAAPTGVAATDSASIAAAFAAAGASGRVMAQPGVYALNYHLVVPDGVDLVGAGGGSTSRVARTTFKCTTAAAQVEIAGGGGTSGGFRVDGNLTATTPFKRSGGVGANARTFHNITVLLNANGGGVNDLCLFYGAQNDYWYQCGFGGADRDMAVFDQGYGGAHFVRCEWTGNAGRYYHRFDNLVGGGVYAVPTDITFDKGIMEQGSTVDSFVQANHAQLITYADHVFVCSTACSAEMISIQTGATGIELHNPYFQSTAVVVPVAGTVAVKVYGLGDITITGRAWYLNFDAAHSCDGNSSFIYDQSHASFFNCNASFVISGGSSYLQVANLVNGIRQIAYAPGVFVAVHYNAARTAFQYEKDANGDERLFPGTGFGLPDIIVGRVAPGVYGVKGSALSMLSTGRGTLALRPAAPGAAAAGSLYFNTDTNTVDVWDGAAWHSQLDFAWVAPALAQGANSAVADESPAGYTKSLDGRVQLRGSLTGVAPGAIFTLPAGFRPAHTAYFKVVTFTGGGVLTDGWAKITKLGVLSLIAGAANVTLDLSFVAEV